MTETGCQRCGRCCMTANINLPGIKVNDGSGFAEWLAFHRCDVLNQGPEENPSLALRIPLTCMKLSEQQDGTFRCTIYEYRPEICRSYLCKRAKGEGNPLTPCPSPARGEGAKEKI